MELLDFSRKFKLPKEFLENYEFSQLIGNSNEKKT